MEKTDLRKTLTKEDIAFLVRHAAPAAKNRIEVEKYAENDDSFRKTLIEDDAVLAATVNKFPKILNISPPLFFEILLRGAIKEIKKRQHTIEVTPAYRIRVFDAKETLEFLKNEYVISYLVWLLSSFVFAERLPTKGMNFNVLVSLAKSNNLERESRCLLSQRIADICLFLLGIFPASFFQNCFFEIYQGLFSGYGGKKLLNEYEEAGQEHYKLASKTADTELSYVLNLLSDNFGIARKPLTYISVNYMNFC